MQPELKKGTAEVLILSLLEDRSAPRLRTREADREAVGRRAGISRGVALPHAVPVGTARMDRRPLAGKSRPAAAAILQVDCRRPPCAAGAAQERGGNLSARSNAWRRSAMRDWKKYVREHLPPLGLSGAREQEIVEEIAQQLEDALFRGDFARADALRKRMRRQKRRFWIGFAGGGNRRG